MSSADHPEIIQFVPDMTLLWSCRDGDFLLWMGYSNPFSRPESIQMRDFWEMRDGYRVTISNRTEDLPEWFDLHPTEVRDSLAFKMMARIKDGYQPREPIDGPNLWRAKTADRLAWVGESRPGRTAVNGVLSIVDFHQCALVIGEDCPGGLADFVGFGAPTMSVANPKDVERFKTAVEIVKGLGGLSSNGTENLHKDGP